MRHEPRGSISVVVPMYNEEGNAEMAVKGILGVLKDAFSDFEIIIVESGSTDRTAEIADRLSGEHEGVRVIHQINREGLGSAVRLGLANARKEHILYIDGDEPFDVSEIRKVIPLLGSAKAIAGYRIQRKEASREFISRSYNLLVRVVLGVKVRDVNFSMKLISREVLKKLDLRSDGCFYDAEMIAELQRNGIGIEEIGFEETARKTGSSSLVRFSVVAKILYEMLVYILRRKKRTRV